MNEVKRKKEERNICALHEWEHRWIICVPQFLLSFCFFLYIVIHTYTKTAVSVTSGDFFLFWLAKNIFLQNNIAFLQTIFFCLQNYIF